MACFDVPRRVQPVFWNTVYTLRMQARRFPELFRRAITLVAVFGLLLSCLHVVAGHSAGAMKQAQESGHTGILASADHEHGHSHEGDEVDAAHSSSDHAHDHNPADHIHETASLGSSLAFHDRPFSLTLIAFEPQLLDPGLRHLLDRPPRIVVA